MTVEGRRLPSVFVSSTCTNLKEVRQDIKSFIEVQYGFESLLSEFETFPVDNNCGTVENCIIALNERADIFILILSDKYGYEVNGGKSVTHLEYLYAKMKSIPIFVFIHSSILLEFNEWKADSENYKSKNVDSEKIFEFINEVRDINKEWTHKFEHSKDIISALKIQFGYLFYNCLNIRKKFLDSPLPNHLSHLKGDSLKCFIEKPDYWEFILLKLILKDGFEKSSELNRNYNYKVHIGNQRRFHNVKDLVQWSVDKCLMLIQKTDALEHVTHLNDSFGLPGSAGDFEEIVYFGEMIIKIYQSIIEWALEFDSLIINDEWKALVQETRSLSHPVILAIEGFYNDYSAFIDILVQEKYVQNGNISIDLTIPCLNIESVMAEIKILSNIWKEHQLNPNK